MITALPSPPSRQSPSTFSDDADTFMGALPQFATEANALAAAMNLNATTSTSSTSLAIGTGSKSLTVEASKSYWTGMSVKIAHDSSNWMHGEVTSYNSTTGALVVNVTNTLGSGTETSWTITLSGPIVSLPRVLEVTVFAPGSIVQTGDGKAYVIIPAALNGMLLTAIAATVITAGTTGSTTIQINNVTDNEDMLSTVMSIETGETSTRTSASPGVIDTDHDDVATGDVLRIDVDAVSTTAPYGLIVELVFQ